MPQLAALLVGCILVAVSVAYDPLSARRQPLHDNPFPNLDSRSSKIPKSFGHLPHQRSCVLTISAWNNFGFVQAFFDAVGSSNPKIKCLVWVVADRPYPVPKAIADIHESSSLPFKIVTIRELQFLSPFSMDELAMKFDLVEFSTTIKPLAILYLFQMMSSVEHVMYFDNDCWITDSLDDVLYQLQTKLVVVTPHTTNPIPLDGKSQLDINILMAGVLNFGFVAFSKSFRTIDFLSWWYQRLRYYGFVDLSRGMHFDQNWGHFIINFFESGEYYVIRDNRYNVAYWNLHYTGLIYLLFIYVSLVLSSLSEGERLHIEDGVPHLYDKRVVFMHFSGISLFEKYDMEKISRHQNRYTLSNFPRLRNVFSKYLAHLKSFNVGDFRKIPYGYNFFDNGKPIPKLIRRIYRQMADTVNALTPDEFGIDREWLRFGNIVPFADSNWKSGQTSSATNAIWQNVSLVDYLLGGPYSNIVDIDDPQYFCELERVVYSQRSDLQVAFPEVLGANHTAYKSWARSSLAREYELGDYISDLWNFHHPKRNKFNIQRRFGVSIVGWVNGVFDLGLSAAMVFESIRSTDVPVDVIYPYFAGEHRHVPGRTPDVVITRSSAKPINVFVMNADCTPWLREKYPRFLWQTHYNVGVWTWEFEAFPDAWVPFLADFDEIWTPSLFVKSSIESSPLYPNYRTPVVVIPYGYKFPYKSPVQPSHNQLVLQEKYVIEANVFMFLAMFDYLSVFDRMNPLGVVKTFKEAFPSESRTDVALVLKSSNYSPLHVKSRDALLEAIGGDNRIILIEEMYLTEAEIRDMHSRCDCFVSLHRSEGFSLAIIETMVSLTPTIATDYSGSADFFAASSDVRTAHFPISYTLASVETISDYNPYNVVPGTRWAEPNLSEAVKAMRDVLKGVSRSSLEMARAALNVSFGHEAVG